ncbi:MAG TPA: adenylate/guanylate cyclase domain-containing protein, partial [Acidimicrobiales bacterium]
MTDETTPSRRMGRFVPRLVAEWDLDAPGQSWRALDGSLLLVDISGFTNLSERLARRGRIGAEELTDVLDRVFGTMLGLAYDRGGVLLKFGGDALLLLFRGDHHANQAASAAVEMRAALREAATIPTSVGRVPLRMSVGVHSGIVHLFRVGVSHHELVVAGPAASTTTAMEHAAGPGQIVISDATRALLSPGAADLPQGPGWRLRWRRPKVGASQPIASRPVGPETIARCIPLALRAHLADASGEPEHRAATVGFVRFRGIDQLM